QLDLESHRLGTVCAVRRALCAGQRHLEAATTHAERREELVHCPRQLFCACRPLCRERFCCAGKLCGGLLALRGDVPQVEIRGVEQLELTGCRVACRQHVGHRRDRKGVV